MREKPKQSTPDETNASEATLLDPHESAMFAAELGGAPEVDLHGLDVNLALNELDAFLHSELMRKTDAIRVIHGRGEQKLRAAIWKWLDEMKKKDLVAAYRDTRNPGQQGAVTLVALERLSR